MHTSKSIGAFAFDVVQRFKLVSVQLLVMSGTYVLSRSINGNGRKIPRFESSSAYDFYKSVKNETGINGGIPTIEDINTINKYLDFLYPAKLVDLCESEEICISKPAASKVRSLIIGPILNQKKSLKRIYTASLKEKCCEGPYAYPIPACFDAFNIGKIEGAGPYKITAYPDIMKLFWPGIADWAVDE